MRPDEFFSHATGAIVHGVPLPSALADVLHVSALEPGRPPRRPGIVGHRERHVRAEALVHVGALRVAPPAWCWARLARLVHPYDLVAAADHLLTATAEPDAARERLLSVASRPSLKGRAALQFALARARRGAESRPETWTRLVLIDAGLPAPELQHAVRDERRFYARLDLAYPARRVGIEYDGGQHRTDAAQYARDIDRLDGLAARGWRIIRVDAHLLFRNPGELVRRVAGALTASLDAY